MKINQKFFLTCCVGICLYFWFNTNFNGELKASPGLAHFDNHQHNQVNAQNKIELPPDFQYPNGIAQAEDGTLYVGSVTRGRILQIAPNGKITTFFPGSEEVFAATSLRLDEQRGILWGTSPDFLGVANARGEIVRRPHRVFALDVATREVLRSLSMPDNGFGNDIALNSDGGVYITDSFQPRIHYLAPNANQFETWVEDELFRRESEQIGLAGIARNDDGITIVSMYSQGDLFKITPQSDNSLKVETINLEHPLENPDGMQFTDDSTLLLTEGAMEGGDGRLVRIDVLSNTNPKPIETIVSGLNTPVNLTVSSDEAWITESDIRHRLIPGKEAQIPDHFFIHYFDLSDVK